MSTVISYADAANSQYNSSSNSVKDKSFETEAETETNNTAGSKHESSHQANGDAENPVDPETINDPPSHESNETNETNEKSNDANKKTNLLPAPPPIKNAWGNIPKVNSKNSVIIESNIGNAANHASNSNSAKISTSKNKWLPFKASVIIETSSNGGGSNNNSSAKLSNKNNNKKKNKKKNNATTNSVDSKKLSNKKQEKNVLNKSNENIIKPNENVLTEINNKNEIKENDNNNDNDKEIDKNLDNLKINDLNENNSINGNNNLQNQRYIKQSNINNTQQKQFKSPNQNNLNKKFNNQNQNQNQFNYNRQYNNRNNLKHNNNRNNYLNNFMVPQIYNLPYYQYPTIFNPIVNENLNQNSKDDLLLKISQQVDYYFSIGNLLKDFYLRKNMNSNGFVPLNIIANFFRIKNLSNGNINLVIESLGSCENIIFGYSINPNNNNEKLYKIKSKSKPTEFIFESLDQRLDGGKDESCPDIIETNN